MPDESRVFDVTRPSHVNPSATSKPVIVGHHPQTSDPMVNDEIKDSPEPTRISFTDASPPQSSGSQPDAPKAFSAPEPEPRPDEPAGFFTMPEPPEKPAETTDAPGVFSTPEDISDSAGAADGPSPSEDAFMPVQPQPEPAIESPADTSLPQATTEPPHPHIEGLRFNQPKDRPKWLKFSIIGIVVLLIAAYLAIDSGAIGSGINLPFHVFKQKSASPPATANTPNTANKQAASSAPTVPAGFKEYKLAGTSLTFAAPAAWGDPTSATDAGYSKRGTNIQSDGTYAYIVDFATNKSVEIAVTSSKFLPPTRPGGAILYYDFLQWCTGTNDGKFYQSVLRFSTANKVDTPTTITCDRGPLDNAQKLDSKTLLQTKVLDTAGKILGDIYTKNLTDPSLPVIRIKDIPMTNGPDIKQLLSTVQFTAAPSSSPANQ